MRWTRLALAVVGMGLASLSWGCGSSTPGTLDPAAGDGGVDPTSRENASAAKGAEAVKKRKCPTCHTDAMSGATKMLTGVTTDPRVELFPPNLTPDPDTGIGPALAAPDPTGKKGYTDELLARAIRSGQDNNDQELCPQMKHFADMTDFEVYSIVKYLRALPPVKLKILRSVCPPLKSKDEQIAAAAGP